VLMQKVQSYGDPRLFALSHVGTQLARSTQPLVPERVFLSGTNGFSHSASEGANGNGHGGDGSAATVATTGLVGMLLQTLLADRTSFASGENAELASLKELTSKLTRDALANMPCGTGVSPAIPTVAAKGIAAAN
jgi:hypothetical protein